MAAEKCPQCGAVWCDHVAAAVRERWNRRLERVAARSPGRAVRPAPGVEWLELRDQRTEWQRAMRWRPTYRTVARTVTAAPKGDWPEDDPAPFAPWRRGEKFTVAEYCGHRRPSGLPWRVTRKKWSRKAMATARAAAYFVPAVAPGDAAPAVSGRRRRDPLSTAAERAPVVGMSLPYLSKAEASRVPSLAALRRRYRGAPS